MSVLRALTALCAVSIFRQIAGAQTTIQVPADQPTIQQAIDTAVNGDTVLVSPGTYNQAINFHGKTIRVSGAAASSTILDGTGLGTSIVTFNTGEGNGSVLEKVTIRNGQGSATTIHGSALYVYGGGVLCDGAAPWIRDCIVDNNRPISDYATGAGIAILSANGVRISNCVVSNNWARRHGGGAFIDGSTVTLEDSVWELSDSGWSSPPGSCGGGLYLSDATADIFRCVIRQNRALSNFTSPSLNLGGGINSTGSTLTLRNCTVQGNSGGHSGGGIRSSLGMLVVRDSLVDSNTASKGGGLSVETGTIINSTISRNVASGSPSTGALSGHYGNGGGLSVGGAVNLVSCTITLNSAGHYGSAINACWSCSPGVLSFGGFVLASPVVSATGCIVWNNPAGSSAIEGDQSNIHFNYSDIQGGWPEAGAIGNIDSDPLFWRPETLDFRLMDPGSPCLDTADPTYPQDPDGSVADMGANDPIQVDVINPLNGNRYVASTTKLSYAAAKSLAASLGGYLACPTTSAEQTWINDTFGYGLLWIGLSDELTEGQFFWASGEPFTATNWGTGEPSNSSARDYVQMNLDFTEPVGKWSVRVGTELCHALVELPDCNGNGVLDRDEVVQGLLPDCNGNYSPDACDIALGVSQDCDGNAIPDSCQSNYDLDSLIDACDPDDDNDGALDLNDNCALVANTDQANNDGDTVGDACDPDDDNDGVLDRLDNCQFVANANQANNEGDAQGDVCDLDDDNDGRPDPTDNCPFVANANQANNDGDATGDACDQDDDNDGTVDVFDGCPFDPNLIAPTQCGCGGVAEVDTDNDGVADCVDLCPFDPLKVQPGACGCAHNDTDSDGDGIADCVDPCLFGGTATDTDGDGIPDCRDLCVGDTWRWSLAGPSIGSGFPTWAACNVDEPGVGPSLFLALALPNPPQMMRGSVQRLVGSTLQQVGITGVGEYVSCLAAGHDGLSADLYAGGSFSSMNGVPIARVAKWDGGMWSPLGNGLNGEPTSLVVHSDGVVGPSLYTVGYFTGASSGKVMRWNGTFWSPVGVSTYMFRSGLLEYDDGGGLGPRLLAYDESSNIIGAWDGVAWSTLPAVPGNSVLGLEWAFENTGTQKVLYAIGLGGVYRLTGANWSLIADWSNPQFCNLSGIMRHSFSTGALPSLVAFGLSDALGWCGIGPVIAARWTGSSWVAIDDLGLDPSASVAYWAASVSSTSSGTPEILLGGYFVSPASGETRSLARLSNTCPLGPASFCRGDGTGATCPCGNSGAAGHGCASSAFAGGAMLSANGVAGLSAGTDTLVLTATDIPGPGLFFQSNGLAANPINFGDGHLCAAVGIIRLGVVFPTLGIASYPGGLTPSPIHTAGAPITSGDTKHYQCWYRSQPGLCGPNNYDLTQGLTITWGP